MAVTGHGPACRTVTRATLPSFWNTWVIPSFLARMADMEVVASFVWFVKAGGVSGGQTDLDVHACREMIQALERVDRLGSRLMDVDQTLVRADLEVLTRVLVLERRTNHAVNVLLGRQRHGSGHAGASAGGRLDDLLRRRLDRRGVIRLQADANLVLVGRCHGFWCRCSLVSGLCVESSVCFGLGSLLALQAEDGSRRAPCTDGGAGVDGRLREGPSHRRPTRVAGLTSSYRTANARVPPRADGRACATR